MMRQYSATADMPFLPTLSVKVRKQQASQPVDEMLIRTHDDPVRCLENGAKNEHPTQKAVEL